MAFSDGTLLVIMEEKEIDLIMAITKYRPSNHLRDVFFPRSFGSMFNDLWNDETAEQTYNFFRPSVDVLEHDNSFEIHLSIPGMKKDEISIDLKNDVLTISGERKQKTEKKDAKFHMGEIRYGKFSRTFRLPDHVNAEAIEAAFNDGVLELTIPKAEAAKPKSINIK